MEAGANLRPEFLAVHLLHHVIIGDASINHPDALVRKEGSTV